MKSEEQFKLHHFITAPLMGLLFALFLPAIGVIMTVGVLARKLAPAVGDAIFRVSVFGWRPSEAYLLGRATKKKEDKKDG